MFGVLSVHFCLYANYYGFPVNRADVGVLSLVRLMMYQCVPLFLISTGFLMRGAEFSLRHYIKAIPLILNSYIVGAVVVLYRILALNDRTPLLFQIQSIYQFNQPSYGWYMNMYMSLYMIMPFLNYAFRSMKTLKHRAGGLAVLILLANLAFTVNRFTLHTSAGDTLIGYTPNYFSTLWCVAYYWTGMMIAEYRPKINKLLSGAALVVIFFAETVLNRLTAPEGGGWNQGINFSNEDFVNIITGALMFLILYDAGIKSAAVRKALAFAASLSMTVYLLSYIGDSYYSLNLLTGEHTPAAFVQKYFTIIPLHFLLTLAASIPLNRLAVYAGRAILREYDKKVHGTE